VLGGYGVRYLLHLVQHLVLDQQVIGHHQRGVAHLHGPFHHPGHHSHRLGLQRVYVGARGPGQVHGPDILVIDTDLLDEGPMACTDGPHGLAGLSQVPLAEGQAILKVQQAVPRQDARQLDEPGLEAQGHGRDHSRSGYSPGLEATAVLAGAVGGIHPGGQDRLEGLVQDHVVPQAVLTQVEVGYREGRCQHPVPDGLPLHRRPGRGRPSV